jgi:hypothetical protein
MLSLRNLAAVIASSALFIFLSLAAVAADTSALAKATYLPTELMQLPPQVVIAKDWSGYWAGEDAPLVRCIQVNRPWTSVEKPDDPMYIAPEDLQPMELLPGITLEMASDGALLFYYLSGEGKWIRIGCSVYWYFGINVSVLNDSMVLVKADTSGNVRALHRIYAYEFQKDTDDSVILRDMTIKIEDLPIVMTYQVGSRSELCYVAFPIMGVNWEGYGPFSHADSPDRYILLAQNEDGTVKNVSADYPDYYLQDIASAKARFKQMLSSIKSSSHDFDELIPTWNDHTYMSYSVTLIIRYHDMGKHAEGVRLARQVVQPKCFSSRERYRYALGLIDETIADLKMQDELIKKAIDDYNSELYAKYW